MGHALPFFHNLTYKSKSTMSIRTIILLMAAGTSVAAGAQVKTYLEADFDKGIPSDFTLIDMDDNPVAVSNYQRVETSGSWAANPVDTKGNNAAFSFSSCQYDYPVENWMITPAIHIESADAALRWDAKSIHYDLRESYKVMVSTVSADPSTFKELARIDGEQYTWQTRALPLAEYAGQDIYIAFVATSENKFILAIDNITVGELNDSRFITDDTSRRFVGSASPTAPVSGTITNVSSPVEVKAIECVTDDGTQTMTVERRLSTGEQLDYNFDIPVSLNNVSHYSLRAIPAEGGDAVTLYSDSLFCSHYPKILLAEEGTGTWCNFCPIGTLQGNEMKERLGEDVLVIAVHTRDKLTCNDYNNGISRWISSIPAYIFNRDNTTITVGSVFDEERYNKALALEVPAFVEMDVTPSEQQPGRITFNTRTQFATAYDNTDGRYKLGFAIIEKTVEGTDSTIQVNNSTQINNGEYYYLPLYIPEKLMFFHNIPREGSTAFTGVEGSLPATIEEGETYEYAHTMTLPDILRSTDDLFAVVYVMNTLTGKVFNIAKADIPELSSGIGGVTADSGNSMIDMRLTGGKLDICLPDSNEPYTVTVCGTDGVMTHKVSGRGNTVSLQLSSDKGRCHIVRAVQGRHICTRKIFTN